MSPRALIRPASVFLRCLLLLPWLGLSASGVAAGYQDNQALARELKELARAHKQFVRLEAACRTPQKNDVWRLELGRGSDDERQRRPAMLLAAGLEGNDLAGTASLLAWASALAQAYEKDEAIRKLLDSTTLHLWPRLNPDAAQHFFIKPRRETATNDQPSDDDHDGLMDEDGPDDLDGDGLITWMENELDRHAVTNLAAPGIHRLNRTEYQKVIRDLIGLKSTPRDSCRPTIRPTASIKSRAR